MPKSSSTKRTPSRARRLIVSLTPSGPPDQHRLGDLQARLAGSRPLRVSAPRPCLQVALGELAHRQVHRDASGRESGRDACQRAACAHAPSSTHRPIGSISPLSSAIGMNSAGSIRPRVGCSQRRSASTETIGRPERDDRLVDDAQLLALQRPAQVVLDRTGARRARAWPRRRLRSARGRGPWPGTWPRRRR